MTPRTGALDAAVDSRAETVQDGSIKPETKARLGQAIMGSASVCATAGVTLPIL